MNTLTKFNKLQSSTLNLNKLQKKFLNKTFRPTMYNLRLYYSNLRRNEHSFGRWEMIYGPDGVEKTKTDRNPDNYKYKTNLFSHTAFELRHLYGDALYQMFRRRNRLNDKCMKYLCPVSTIGLYMLSGQHLCFMVLFFITKSPASSSCFSLQSVELSLKPKNLN